MSIFPQTLLPTTVPGLVGWADFSDTSTITSSGGLVSSVRNKANSQIPFIQGTGTSQPTTGTRNINGLNVLDFDGTDDYLTANSLTALFSGVDKPISVFCVCQSDDSSPAVEQAMFGLGKVSTATPLMRHSYYLATYLDYRRDDASTLASGSAGGVTANIATVSGFVFTGTTLSAYFNSATIFSGTSFDVGTITLDVFSVGGNYRGGALATPFNGRYGEIIIYNRSVSDSERISIQRYLGNKWGIVTS